VAEHPADAPRLRAADGEGFACDEDYDLDDYPNLSSLPGWPNPGLVN
jgi:hypothetical protein